MKVISKDFYSVKKLDKFSIYPIGCTHLGAAGVDEERLKEVVKEIAADEHAYWIGLGDYGNFINRNDKKRFNPLELAPWIQMKDLVDLPKAQVKKIREIFKPVAQKCLALVEGNHEREMKNHYERDVYMEIVDGIKQDGGFAPEVSLATGYYGYLDLTFYRTDSRKDGSRQFRISLHHGSAGTEIAAQKWLYAHECDIALFAHIHKTRITNVGVEYVDKAGQIKTKKRYAAHCGTFLTKKVEGVDDYGSIKGYAPPVEGGVVVEMRPLAEPRERSIRITEY